MHQPASCQGGQHALFLCLMRFRMQPKGRDLIASARMIAACFRWRLPSARVLSCFLCQPAANLISIEPVGCPPRRSELAGSSTPATRQMHTKIQLMKIDHTGRSTPQGFLAAASSCMANFPTSCVVGSDARVLCLAGLRVLRATALVPVVILSNAQMHRLNDQSHPSPTCSQDTDR